MDEGYRNEIEVEDDFERSRLRLSSQFLFQLGVGRKKRGAALPDLPCVIELPGLLVLAAQPGVGAREVWLGR